MTIKTGWATAEYTIASYEISSLDVFSVIKYLIRLEIGMASSLRKRPKLHDDIRRATTEKFIIIHIENCCHTVYFKIAEEIQDTIACIIFVGVKRAL